MIDFVQATATSEAHQFFQKRLIKMVSTISTRWKFMGSFVHFRAPGLLNTDSVWEQDPSYIYIVRFSSTYLEPFQATLIRSNYTAPPPPQKKKKKQSCHWNQKQKQMFSFPVVPLWWPCFRRYSHEASKGCWWKIAKSDSWSLWRAWLPPPFMSSLAWWAPMASSGMSDSWLGYDGECWLSHKMNHMYQLALLGCSRKLVNG